MRKSEEELKFGIMKTDVETDVRRPSVGCRILTHFLVAAPPGSVPEAAGSQTGSAPGQMAAQRAALV